MARVVLEMGCGNKKHGNAIGLDMHKTKKTDLVCDFNKGIPFASESVDYIYCHNLIAHLDDLVKAMKEIERVLKKGGEVEFIVPYYASSYAFSDPTIKHLFAWRTFDYFTRREQFNYYCGTNFEIIEKRFGNLGRFKLWGKLVCAIANRFPAFYERFLNSFFKADILFVKMRKK